jgi:hypothetical protein
MAAATTADLKRLTHARNLLKHELAHLQVDVKKVTKAADNDARTLERMRKQTVVLREELSELANDTSTLAASLPRRTSRVEQLRRLHSPGVLLIVALVAAMAFTALVLRTRRVETRTRGSEPVPMLSSRPLLASPLLTLVTVAAPSPIVTERQPTAIVPDRRLPVAATPVQLEETASAAQPFVGSLSIDSEPSGATVFVNRRAVGETPMMLDSLRVGSYVIRLELGSYQPWTAAVRVSAIGQTRVSATLQK